MSFRTEEKLRVAPDKIFILKKWIKKNNGKKLYPKRFINSIGPR